MDYTDQEKKIIIISSAIRNHSLWEDQFDSGQAKAMNKLQKISQNIKYDLTDRIVLGSSIKKNQIHFDKINQSFNVNDFDLKSYVDYFNTLKQKNVDHDTINKSFLVCLKLKEYGGTVDNYSFNNDVKIEMKKLLCDTPIDSIRSDIKNLIKYADINIEGFHNVGIPSKFDKKEKNLKEIKSLYETYQKLYDNSTVKTIRDNKIKEIKIDFDQKIDDKLLKQILLEEINKFQDK